MGTTRQIFAAGPRWSLKGSGRLPGDDEQRPKACDDRKAGPRRRHQRRCGKQKQASRMPVGDPPDPERHQCRADQRAGHDGADRQCAEAALDQVDRQQKGDKAVAKRPHAARREGIGRGPRRHDRVEKVIGMLFLGQRRGGVEMHRRPAPLPRDDAVRLAPVPRSGMDPRQQDVELGCDGGPRFLLQAAPAQHAL